MNDRTRTILSLVAVVAASWVLVIVAVVAALIVIENLADLVAVAR